MVLHALVVLHQLVVRNQHLKLLSSGVQDFSSVFDPGNETGGTFPVAQIIWDVFNKRFGTGIGGLVVLCVPLGTSFFCALFSVTSAARCILNTASLMQHLVRILLK